MPHNVKNAQTISMFLHSYDFIAFGVGEGQLEKLDDLAYKNARYLRSETFDQLTTLLKKDGNNLQFWINNPDKALPTPKPVEPVDPVGPGKI